MSEDIKIAVYYFPNYHQDDRNDSFHGEGWTEWKLVQEAAPRFPGHQQPKVPQWGYEDESDPKVMARKIDAAADHGITSFLFDWYWYDDGPFLGRALKDGFMQASNVDRLEFALMWANHDWIDLHPASRNMLGANSEVLYPGMITSSTWDKMTDYIIENYFKHPSYMKIDGSPFFQIYELYRLVEGLGGQSNCRDALQAFRKKTRKAGFEDLHLNAVVWGIKILPGEKELTDPQAMLDFLGFDSVTSYVWVHHLALDNFPTTDYLKYTEKSAAMWPKLACEYTQPYFPNVTMGWDPSPRTNQDEEYTNAGYPFTPILHNNTPANFEHALQKVKTYLDSTNMSNKILTINAWNEWTEGSYIEPDMVNGMGYLEAIKDVFYKETFNQREECEDEV